MNTTTSYQAVHFDEFGSTRRPYRDDIVEAMADATALSERFAAAKITGRVVIEKITTTTTVEEMTF